MTEYNFEEMDREPKELMTAAIRKLMLIEQKLGIVENKLDNIQKSLRILLLIGTFITLTLAFDYMADMGWF